jgi:hypothetical protein
MVIGGGGLALGVFTLWILGSASPAQADSACTINWVGPSTGGPWATASNWSTGQTPGTGDVVCISGVTGTVTFDGSGDTSTTLISELRSSAPLAITGGELGLTDAAATGNTVAGFSMSGGQLGDTTNAQGSLIDTGDFSWTAGSFHAPAGESPQPTFTQSSSTNAATIADPDFLDNWNLDLGSPLGVSGVFAFENGGSITESNTVTLADDTFINDGGSAGPFTITGAGTLTKAATSGTAVVGVPVASAGTVMAGGGALILSSLTNTGTLDLATGIVSISSSYSPADGSALAVTLAGTTAGTTYGQLEVAGTTTLAGSLVITTASGFIPTIGQTFAITESAVSSTGNFSSVVEHDSPSGLGYLETGTPSGVVLTATAVAISPSTLPEATTGEAYSATLNATGGNSPYTWALTSGTLPAGLSLHTSTGVISGTPTAVGTSTFTVRATDSSSPALSATATYSLNVVKFAIALSSLPTATVGDAYSSTLTVTGGTSPYSWALTSGTLPAGLSLHGSTGVISGTPTTAGAFKFTVRVTDAARPALSTTRTYTLTVKLAISPSSLSNATTGEAYSVTLTATGGSSPYTWVLVSGGLPVGLSLHGSTGVISGTPTGTGTRTFTVRATDSSSPALSATATYSLKVVKLVISPSTLPEATVGDLYSVTLSATGGISPYTWALTSGSLPAGLSLHGSTGVISGTPSHAGTSRFTVRLTDSASPAFSVTKTYSLTCASG